MLRAIRYEINPTKSQQVLIKKTCGCCRLVYNIMLDKKINAYENEKIKISAYDLVNDIPKLKDEKEFLKEVASQALQQAINNLDHAYKSFFKRGNKGYPKFKKKGQKDSYRIPIPCVIDYDKWVVKVAKIGNIKIFKGRNKQINGPIKSYTISHTSTDRYFISVLYECNDKLNLNNNESIGIDVGIKTFAVLSDGTEFENQKLLKSNLLKLRILQRSASRKYKRDKKVEDQSSNYRKAQKRVAKLHERIRFQRLDYLHKKSSWIAKNYSTVCLETLNIRGMVKNKKLSRAISDCGWGLFITMLEYKCDKVVKIDRWLPSSQTCSECGYINKQTKNLSVRKWSCPNCGVIHDRDINAAKNIKREGLSLCEHNVDGYIKRVPELNELIRLNSQVQT